MYDSHTRILAYSHNRVSLYNQKCAKNRGTHRMHASSQIKVSHTDFADINMTDFICLHRGGSEESTLVPFKL